MKRMQKILEHIIEDTSVFCTGPGGTGKSHLLRDVARELVKKDYNVAMTSSTGISAINLNVPDIKLSAKTLHSWAGIGLGRDSADKLLAYVKGRRTIRAAISSADVLIIDEISMLGGGLFDKLEYVVRNIRGGNKPFGGLVLLLSGDFLQLPPINDLYTFESNAWKALDPVPIVLTDPIRYDDEKYFDMLLRIRKGRMTSDDLSSLRSRVYAYDQLMKSSIEKFSIKPTILYSTKKDVSSYNEEELAKLDGDATIFTAADKFISSYGTKSEPYECMFDDTIPRIINLKPGAQVMLRVNLDVSRGLVNGSRGVVMELGKEYVTVKFLDGSVQRIIPYTWKIEDKNMIASRRQIPLILAWSYTIHKTQGLTLDLAVCDCGTSIFAPSQMYVALSRVRNLAGLYITTLHPPSLKVNKKALEYVETIEKLSMLNIEKDIEKEKRTVIEIDIS